MVCGIDTNILALDGLKKTLIAKVKSLGEVAGGLAENRAAITALVSKDLSAITKKLTEAVPSLASLIPNATLQGDMTSLLGMISNPAGFASQAASIVSKYGSVPGVDIAGLADSILSGNISADTICKFIPNVQIDALNNVIKKGIIPVPPTKAVEKLLPIFDGKEQANAKKVFDNARASLLKGASELKKRVGDGKLIAKMTDDITTAKCPGGIMAATAAVFQDLSGGPIPEELKKAMTGAPGSMTLACGSAELENSFIKFQEEIRKGAPKMLEVMNEAGDIVSKQFEGLQSAGVGDPPKVLSNFPGAIASATGATAAGDIVKSQIEALQKIFPATEGGDESGSAASVSGDADTSGA